jgi:heat shock protein HtpX
MRVKSSMETPQGAPVTFQLRTEVAPSHLGDLLVFLYQQYILPFYSSFTNVKRWLTNEGEVLAFTLVDGQGFWHVDLEVAAGNVVKVKMTPFGDVPPKVLSRLREDLIIAVQVFEEKVRRTTLYFAWVPDKKVVPEKAPDKGRKIINQIFMGNMLMFFVIFIALSYAAFLVITEVFGIPAIYFPIILVAAQFVMVLFSHKIVGKMGDWPITASNPNVHILQYHIPPEQLGFFQQEGSRDLLLKIKHAILSRTFTSGMPISSEAAQEAFQDHGISLKPENIKIKTVNVYNIVKEAATRFKMSVPKIKLSNVIVPNAAATGPSPRFGLVLITTGLLVQLNEEEMLAVIGHEMSHVRRRDPLALSVLVSAEYLIRVYFLWNYVFFLYYFGLFYIFFAFGMIYFIAKFFEARADLESAMNIGHPEVLAGALRKIGFRRIQLERMQSNRLGSWLGWNPHPPISFRVERLENLGDPQKIRHPFLQSIKDCIDGLLYELRRL